MYAKETLSDARSQEGDVDKKTYYEVMSDTAWTVMGEIGVGIPVNQLIVARYDFANAVFAQDLTSDVAAANVELLPPRLFLEGR